MIQKSTILSTSDTTGISTVNCFHVYQKKKQKWGSFGNFIKISTRLVFFRSLKFRKRKFKAIIVLLRFRFTKFDGSYLYFYTNTCVPLKRRVIPIGSYITGCCIYNLKRKKFLASFVKTILVQKKLF